MNVYNVLHCSCPDHDLMNEDAAGQVSGLQAVCSRVAEQLKAPSPDLGLIVHSYIMNGVSGLESISKSEGL